MPCFSALIDERPAVLGAMVRSSLSLAASLNLFTVAAYRMPLHAILVAKTMKFILRQKLIFKNLIYN